MIVPGISQTLRRYQGNKSMAREKLYLWIVKRMKIWMNSLNLFSLASDHKRYNALRGVHYKKWMEDAEALELSDAQRRTVASAKSIN